MHTTHLAGRVFALGLVAVLALLAGALSACSGEDESEVDAATVLSEAAEAMQEVESFHFAYQVQMPGESEPIEGTHLVALDGAVAVGGLMEATIDLQQGGVPLQLEFVADEDTHYVKNPMSGTWQSVAAPDSPIGELDLSAGTIQILEQIEGASYVATEDAGGVESYRIEGRVSAEDLAAVAGAVTTEDPFATEVWIGIEDRLVRQIEVTGAALESEPPETKRVITLDRFDEPVSIEPPK